MEEKMLESFKGMKERLVALQADADVFEALVKSNKWKAAARRMRRLSIQLAAAGKEFRRDSVAAAKASVKPKKKK